MAVYAAVEVDAFTSRHHGYKGPDQEYSIRTAGQPALGLFNLLNLALLLAIIDARVGCYEPTPSFKKKVPELLKSVWAEAGFTYLSKLVGPNITFYTAGRSTGIYVFRWLRDFFERALQMLKHEREVSKKHYQCDKIDPEPAVRGEAILQVPCDPRPSSVETELVPIPCSDKTIPPLRDLFAARCTRGMLEQLRGLRDRFHHNPKAVVHPAPFGPDMYSLVVRLLEPPAPASPTLGLDGSPVRFDPSLAHSRVWPRFRTAVADTLGVLPARAAQTEPFPFSYAFETWKPTGWLPEMMREAGDRAAVRDVAPSPQQQAQGSAAPTARHLAGQVMCCKDADTMEAYMETAHDLYGTSGFDAVYDIILECAGAARVPTPDEKAVCRAFMRGQTETARAEGALRLTWPHRCPETPPVCETLGGVGEDLSEMMEQAVLNVPSREAAEAEELHMEEDAGQAELEEWMQAPPAEVQAPPAEVQALEKGRSGVSVAGARPRRGCFAVSMDEDSLAQRTAERNERAGMTARSKASAHEGVQKAAAVPSRAPSVLKKRAPAAAPMDPVNKRCKLGSGWEEFEEGQSVKMLVYDWENDEGDTVDALAHLLQGDKRLSWKEADVVSCAGWDWSTTDTRPVRLNAYEMPRRVEGVGYVFDRSLETVQIFAGTKNTVVEAVAHKDGSVSVSCADWDEIK